MCWVILLIAFVDGLLNILRDILFSFFHDLYICNGYYIITCVGAAFVLLYYHLALDSHTPKVIYIVLNICNLLM